LKEARVRNTLSLQQLYARLARQRRALFLDGRLFRPPVHLLPEKLPDAVNREQTFAATLSASSKRRAPDQTERKQLVQQTAFNPKTLLNANRV
jgi:hypothetical protein